MQKLNRDIGSSFYALQNHDWEYKLLSENEEPLQQHYNYYYSGRNAILAILKEIESKQDINTIWLPNYYCDTVVNMIQHNFKDVQFYPVNPFGEFDSQVNFTAFSKTNDVLILNNFWGLSSFEYDAKSVKNPTIIEDHSHGWLSNPSKNSQADYCICAIRKSYPIPTGGITWKPNSEDTLGLYEHAEDQHIVEAWNTFRSSMSLKRKYIKEDDASVKEDYLALLNKAELELNKSNHYIKPDEDASKIYKDYITKNPNTIKATHLKYINKHLKVSRHFKVIQREGFIPFGLLLLFQNEVTFLNFKKVLVSKHIFPAHLWPNNTMDLESQYLFNIHVDFRYDMDDMKYIVDTINHWDNKITIHD